MSRLVAFQRISNVLLFLVIGVMISNGNKTNDSNQCSCTIFGHHYNLRSLARKDGKPRLQSEKRGWNYAYNPCIPFSIEPPCEEVAVCRWDHNVQRITNLGLQKDMFCQTNKGKVEFVFPIPKSQPGWITKIVLKCDASRKGVDDGLLSIVDDAAVPVLQLEHNCCCPDACPDVNPTRPTPASSTTYSIVGEIIGGFAGFLLIVGGIFYFRRRNQNIRDEENRPLIVDHPEPRYQAVENRDPVYEAPDSSSEESDPDDEASDHEGEAPDPEGEAPDLNDEAPDPEGEAPDPEGQASDPEVEDLDPEGEAPDPEGEAPDPEGEAPDINDEAPDPEGEAPDPEGQASDPEVEDPNPEGQAPDVNDEALDPEGQAPDLNDEDPDPEGEAPDPEGQASDPEVEDPAPEREVPIPDGEAHDPDGGAHGPEGEYPASIGEASNPDGHSSDSHFEVSVSDGEAPDADDEASDPDSQASHANGEVPDPDAESSDPDYGAPIFPNNNRRGESPHIADFIPRIPDENLSYPVAVESSPEDQCCEEEPSSNAREPVEHSF